MSILELENVKVQFEFVDYREKGIAKGKHTAKINGKEYSISFSDDLDGAHCYYDKFIIDFIYWLVDDAKESGLNRKMIYHECVSYVKTYMPYVYRLFEDPTYEEDKRKRTTYWIKTKSELFIKLGKGLKIFRSQNLYPVKAMYLLDDN